MTDCAGCKIKDSKLADASRRIDELQGDVERLETQVKMQQAFSRSCNNDRERLRKELERLRAKDG